MRMLITFQNKLVPVYFTTENKQPTQKVLRLLNSTLELKIQRAKVPSRNASIL